MRFMYTTGQKVLEVIVSHNTMMRYDDSSALFMERRIEDVLHNMPLSHLLHLLEQIFLFVLSPPSGHLLQTRTLRQ